MPLYFAYGANMDVGEMARRCPRSRPIGLARFMRHRLAIMREGWLTATHDSSATTHGVLWNLAFADIAALDRFEGVAGGLYFKATQPVLAAGGPKRALVYFGANAGPGRARPDYMRAVIVAARFWRLPPEGMATLEALARDSARVPPGFAGPPR
jgi:hypothetical protein